MIEIDGQVKATAQKRRFLVKIDGKEVWLTGVSFRILTMLAFARTNGEGWVHQSDLSTAGARYIYRLKQELGHKGAMIQEAVVESSGKKDGYYRLTTDQVTFNPETLKNHDDWDVRRLFITSSEHVVDEN